MPATAARPSPRTHGLTVWGPLVALWLVWGATYLGIAVMGDSLPPLMANGLRFLAAAAVLGTALVLIRGPQVLRITRSQVRSVATMGVGILGVGIGTISLAERVIPSGIVALLVAVMPLYVVLLRLRAGDRPARLTLLGVAVGFAGLALMLLPGGTAPRSGTDADVVVWSIAVLCSTFSWAFFSWRSAGYSLPANPLVTTTYEMAFAALALVGVGALRGERFDVGHVAAASWWAWAFLILASIVGYTAFTWLLGHAPLSLTATYAYVNPVVAVVLGFALVGEAITRDVIVGLTIVVGGVALVVSGESWPSGRRRRRPPR